MGEGGQNHGMTNQHQPAWKEDAQINCDHKTFNVFISPIKVIIHETDYLNVDYIFQAEVCRHDDSLGLRKLPSIQSLRQEYATLLAENKKLYPGQKKAKAEMMELLTAKHNVMRILGLTERDAQHDRHQEER